MFSNIFNQIAVSENEGDYARFLEATKKGYLFAQDNPDEAVGCLVPFLAEQDWNIDVLQSQEFTSPFYGTRETWGVLDTSKVAQYLDWLVQNKLEQRVFSVEELVVAGLV